MKKLLLASFAIVLVGAGCFGGGGEEKKAPEVVEGDWVLALDLPDEWVMTSPYKDGESINLDNKIEKLDAEVYLQSTNLTILRGGNLPEELEESGSYVTDNFVFITVTHLDERRIVPSEAEDLGNGFSKLDPCDEVEDCGGAGAPAMKYYLQTETGKFQFNAHVRGHELSEAEAVILTALETTN